MNKVSFIQHILNVVSVSCMLLVAPLAYGDMSPSGPASAEYGHNAELQDTIHEHHGAVKASHVRTLDQRTLFPKALDQDDKETIEVNLDKIDLPNLLTFISNVFSIQILTGDATTPPSAGKVSGNLITYKTHTPLTKRQLWDLFLRFLDILNLTLIPNAYDDSYPVAFTVVPLDASNATPLPVLLGINWRELPENDTKIRYVYFVENSQLATLNNIAQDFKSKTGIILPFEDLNALIFTDKASNIRSIMKILSELDSTSMPEALSVLKLKHVNAEDVVALYENLVTKEEQKQPAIAARLFGQKKQPTALYFSEDIRLIAEPRTNALIIFGTRAGIHKVEDFILNHVDTTLEQPYSPLYVYDLQYANADNLADILNKVTAFAPASKASQYGGVRDGDKYFRPMQFISEPTGNRLLIRAEKDDYLKIRKIIEQLDVKQPQVAIEVLIVNVRTDKVRQLGAQIRNKSPGSLPTKNIEFQTSGITGGEEAGILTTQTGKPSLMANLIQLAQGQSAGTTLISIGNNLVGGVYALFKALQTYLYTSIVSWPFLTTTNKFTARVSLGETRRVATGTVQSNATVTTQDDLSANLSVEITPQINLDGVINLEIKIDIDTFTDALATSATRDTKTIRTNANVMHGSILAIGGLLQNRYDEATTRVPLLSRIPILGWLFKNKSKEIRKDNLLVFISPRLVEPMTDGGVGQYTASKADYSKNTICSMFSPYESRDPIHRWFFKDCPQEHLAQIDNFLEHATPCPILEDGIDTACARTPLTDNIYAADPEKFADFPTVYQKEMPLPAPCQETGGTTARVSQPEPTPGAEAVHPQVKKRRSIMKYLAPEQRGAPA